jgi:oligopeptide/dipeptide ABC transporter ATP-binding protein
VTTTETDTTTAPVQGRGAAGNDDLLVVEDLSVGFPTDDGLVRAVRGVSYSLRSGEVLGIVGESGSGKSVTSLAVMGLLPGSAQISGSVRFRGQELLGAADKMLSRVRGDKIAMIFQDPMTSLNPVYTVGWQLAEAVRAHHDVSKHAAWDRAVELVQLVGIPNAKQRAGEYPHEFSGGMRQRVVIAMAMANDPDVIIADEPTTALDVTIQAQILETLDTAQNETGAAMVLITHDLGVVAGQADRVLVMYAGKAVEIGSVDDIYYQPRMPYTLGLLGSLPRLDQRRQSRLTPIVGSPPSLINLPPGCPFTPRCPLATERCEEIEPDLLATTSPAHVAACHYSERLVGVQPSDIFHATSEDTELPAAADVAGTDTPPEDAPPTETTGAVKTAKEPEQGPHIPGVKP